MPRYAALYMRLESSIVMSSPLESLSNELLDVILTHLHILAILNLMHCNTQLQQRLEPVLHGQQLQNDKAMRYACLNGVNTTIRRAALYGTSSTAPEVLIQRWL